MPKAMEQTETRIAVQNWLLRNRPFLLFVPAIVASVAWALSQETVAFYRAALLWVAGVATWSLLEWSLHRAMHVRTGVAWIYQLQDSAHLRHHREPDDLEHSVVRLRVSIPVTLLLCGVARLVLGAWPPASLAVCGVLSGYLFYEFVHLTAHAPRRLPGLRQVHNYHIRHHFESAERGFGVTSPVWDWIFRTLPPTRLP